MQKKPSNLYHIKLYRYLQSSFHFAPFRGLKFLDEYNKLTWVRYKFVAYTKRHINSATRYIYKLDARSVRYMQRVSIIENKEKPKIFSKHPYIVTKGK